MRGIRIIMLAVLFLGVFQPARDALTQADPTGPDVASLIRSTVSIFAGKDCDFATESARDPEGIPSFDALLDTCPQGSRGSGTILNADGTILTNAHVALTSLDLDAEPIWLLVSVTFDAREAPEPLFFARAETYDVLLDLAVIRPYYDLDGRPLSPSDIEELALQPLPIAQTPVNIGDEILNIGYPGIGGDLVTVTSGRVSGFQADLNNPELENEGWIKTDATLGGGISGGTTINTAGELVGVPTRVGDIELRQFGESAQVPVGQINYIRPIAVGIPELMRRAKETGQPVMEENLLEGEESGPDDGDDPSIRPNPNEIPAFAEVGEEVEEDAEQPPAGDEAADAAPTTAPAQDADDAPAMVTVSGSIIEVNTGDPIVGAFFIVLQPGHTFQQWYEDGLPASTVYTVGETGADGTFTLLDPLEAGEEYTYVVVADGYDFVWGNTFEIVPAGTEDDLELAPIQVRSSPFFTSGDNE